MVEPSAKVSDELLKKYADVSNATVLGTLLRCGYDRVYMHGVKSLAPGRRLAGRAVTLRYLPSRPDLAKRIATGAHGEGFNETPRWQALESLGPGDVFVGDAMGLSTVSTGGDVVFSRILTKGAAGLVTDGGVRDGHKVIKYGYPVFAGGSTPTVGEPNILPYSVNEPVQCGGVLVWPGDVILGDDSGIVVLPSLLAEEIYEECVEHDETEQALLEYTQERGISPKSFYPFNDDTKRIYEEWKKRPGQMTGLRRRERSRMSDRQIQITVSGVTVVATLNDSPTSDKVWDALPVSASVQTWGDEIYFGIPVELENDDYAEETVEMGAVGYWPPGNALCLFFGATPMSAPGEIRPASAVNVMGMIKGDSAVLKQVSSGASITVEKA